MLASALKLLTNRLADAAQSQAGSVEEPCHGVRRKRLPVTAPHTALRAAGCLAVAPLAPMLKLQQTHYAHTHWLPRERALDSVHLRFRLRTPRLAAAPSCLAAADRSAAAPLAPQPKGLSDAPL